MQEFDAERVLAAAAVEAKRDRAGVEAYLAACREQIPAARERRRAALEAAGASAAGSETDQLAAMKKVSAAAGELERLLAEEVELTGQLAAITAEAYAEHRSEVASPGRLNLQAERERKTALAARLRATVERLKPEVRKIDEEIAREFHAVALRTLPLGAAARGLEDALGEPAVRMIDAILDGRSLSDWLKYSPAAQEPATTKGAAKAKATG
jgi:hypothetical protein